MSAATERRERDRRFRSLVLVGLVALGTACGGGGDSRSAGDRPAAATERPAGERTAAEGQQQVIPSPFGANPAEALANRGASQTAPVPPPPLDLGTQRPQVPPNTVSLESLHQQGRAHVVR